MTAIEDGEEVFAGPWWMFRPFQGAALSGVLLALGFLLSRLGLITDIVAIALYLAAIPPGAFYWLREAAEELVKERAIGNEALMAAAAVGACVLGAGEEAAFLVFLYGSAEAIEEYTSARTRSAIRALLDLAPKEAQEFVAAPVARMCRPARRAAATRIGRHRSGKQAARDRAAIEGMAP